jgi:hypothetical protein
MPYMGGVAQKETPPIARARNDALVHLEVGKPAEIAQSYPDAGPGIEHSAQFGCCWKFALCFSVVAIDENKPAVPAFERLSARAQADSGVGEQVSYELAQETS